MGKLWLELLAAALLVLCSATATAEQPRVTIAGIARAGTRGDRETAQVNLADCLADDRVKMTLGLDYYQGYALEVWAGTGCSALANRSPATATCWQVLSVIPSHIVTTVELGVRELLRGRTKASSGANGAGSADGAECEDVSQANGPQVLTAYVLLLDGRASVAAEAHWELSYRLHGSLPPEGFTVASGDGKLLLDLPSTIADPYLAGFQLYCDPAPDDANASANAQVTTDNAGAIVPSCPATAELIPGASPATLEHLRCGSARATDLPAVADGLVNGVSYNIALASVDTYGNVGPLSHSACQVPQASADHATAKACAIGASGPARPGSALACLMAISAVAARRRRRLANRDGGARPRC